MARANYRFLTTWLIEADRERVFDALYEGERWPEWWPGCLETENLGPAQDGGVGRRGRYRWRSRTGYQVEFEIEATAVERPYLLEGRATGDLSGHGCWRLFDQGGITCVTYEWEVETTKAWMRLLGPGLRMLMRSNHDRLMSDGAIGLARQVGGHLIVAS